MKNYLKPFLNLKFLISFGLAWLITNGWSYICLGVGTLFKIKWLMVVASSYIAFLYLPFTFEKLITIPLAIFIQTKLFKNDKKLRKDLLNMQNQARKDYKNFFRIYLIRKDLKLLGE